MFQQGKLNNIDIQLYSRQLGIIDIDTMKKFSTMNFLIIGLRGLGIEILKNLLLEGPSRVDIYDPNLIKINDLNSNYFVIEEDINKVRDETIIERIKDLNPNVESRVIKQNISVEDINYENELEFIISNIQNYNMIIITEFVKKNTIIKINEECTKLKKGLIYTCALGLGGFLFNDFGKEHIISSPYGKDDNFYPIKNIKKGVKTTIYLESSLEGFPDIEDNGYIKLRDIKGMTELNNDNIYKTKIISISEYEIDINSSDFNDYTYGGFVQVISLPKKMKFKSFEKDLINPMENKEREFINIPYIGRNDIVHSIIYSLYENEKEIDKSMKKRSFIIDEELLPELDNEQESKILSESAKEFFNTSKINNYNWIQIEDIYDENSEKKEFDEKLANNLCLYLKAELPPITSFLGGIVAQEAVKLTGKFTPFNQWFEFEFSYLNMDIKEKTKKEKKNIEKSRYLEQIKVFGEEVQNKLSSLNIFLVGAGAVGCEYLKNFAMMGISSKEGTLTLTDFDKIELSNLNRQFLFRENNIGLFKSEVAKDYVKKMNKSFNIKSYDSLVGQETENIFSDNFWDKQDIIFNALDNVKGRLYLNEKVTTHQKYHVDAGTLGVNSSSCIFLKNASSTYKEQNGNKKEEDDNNDNIREEGMCTIHSFPTCIKHCIEWARNEYEYIFKDFIHEINQIIHGDVIFLYKLLIKKLFPFYKKIYLKQINDMCDILISKSYTKAIQFSYIIFRNKYNFEINNFLKEHPENSKDKEGNNFYTGSKHTPIIIDFNINNNIDELIICYVKSYANLIFDNLRLSKTEDEKKINDNEIKNICIKTEYPTYDGFDIKSIISDIKYDKEYCKNFIDDLQKKIINNLSIKSLEEIALNEIFFIKDNMNNSQYDFMYACSNLRAINFQIPICDYLKIKNISSKIVPSIVTSNAVITGLASMQIYLLAKFLIEKEKNNNNILESEEALKYFRNYYINLGLNGYTYTKLPKKILHNKCNDVPKDWTAWDSIIINGPLKISEFMNEIEKKYNIEIISIISGKSLIFDNKDSKEMADYKVEELFEKITGIKIGPNKKYLTFNLIANSLDGKEINMPRIKYCLSIK